MMLLLAAAAAPWFVCDAIDRPVAYVVAPPAGGQVAITTVAKPSGRRTTRTYAIGRGDPGMGQVHYPLGPGGRSGNLHLVNPQMIDGGAATVPATGVTLGGRAAECRWLADTRLNGVTGRRGVGITREGRVLIYRTYDFARPGRVVRPDGVQRTTVPSLEIRGGMAEGSRFRFANAGYSYVVDGGAGTLTVRRAGRIVQIEPFIGLTIAR